MWRTLSPEQRQGASLQLWQQLQQLSQLVTATDVMLFHSLHDEADTLPLLEMWHKNKQLWLPAVVGNDIEIRPYNASCAMAVGAYGINEPITEAHTTLPKGAVAIVPAVAFDRCGNRLGRGKGYYDRFLADYEVVKIGVALDFQLYNQLPTHPHDIAMDIIVTPSEVIYVNR